MTTITASMYLLSIFLLYLPPIIAVNNWDTPIPPGWLNAEGCLVMPLLGKDAVGPEKTCASIKPSLYSNGTVTEDNTGIYGGNHYANTVPGKSKDVSKCVNISPQAALAESSTGDSVIWKTECANSATGWTHMRIFSARDCVGPEKKASTQIYQV